SGRTREWTGACRRTGISGWKGRCGRRLKPSWRKTNWRSRWATRRDRRRFWWGRSEDRRGACMGNRENSWCKHPRGSFLSWHMMRTGRRRACVQRSRRPTMSGDGTVNGAGTSTAAVTPEKPAAKLRQRMRRKPVFAMPPVAWPVKGLWEAASAEERAAAHRMGTLLFEHWLGRISRKELAAKIGLPPVRVWQLSQQALAGLVVGLLKQPATPPQGT